MQTPSTAYAQALKSQHIVPVYLLIFSGIPTRYSTGTVSSPAGTTKNYLLCPDGAGQQVTPFEGRSSIGSMNFSILDVNGEITFLQQQYQLGNRTMTLKMGFQDMSESAYCTIFSGKVLSYTLMKDKEIYQFSTLDMQTQITKTIFDAVTKVTVAVNPGDVTINVGNTAKFAAATGALANATFYFRIDNEVISYTGKTSTTFTGCTRGALGTTAASHALNAQVLNFIVLQDNPLNIALQILTSTGLGTNGPYDILPASCGLAIPQTQVNVARFQRERDRWTTSRTFRFEEQNKQRGKDFLEQQIYTFIPAYPVVDNQGLLSVKVAAPPLPNDFTTVTPLTDDNVRTRPNFKGNVLNNYFFNELDLQYDYNFLTQGFNSEAFYESPSSQSLFGTVTTKAYQSRGIRSSIMPQPVIDNFGTRFLKRYSVPAPQLEAVGLLSTRLLETGDVIPLSSSKLPNLTTGKIGVTARPMEIIDIQPAYSRGEITYVLLDTGYSYQKRYAAITPTTKPPINFPVYSAATPAQRNYAFISTKDNATKGHMNNGDDGYYITP